MQATQLFLSIGCTAAPLLVSPFLTEIKALELPHGNLSELQHNSSALGVLEGTVLDVPKFKHYKVISVENSSIPAIIEDDDSVMPTAETNMTNMNQAFNRLNMIVPYSYITFSLIVFAIFVVFIIVYFMNGPTCKLKKSVRQAAKQNDINTPWRFLFSLYALMFFFFFLLMWISGLGHLLPTFVVDGLGWEVKHGSIIAALFWGCLGLGRVVGIPLSTRMTPAAMLILDTGLAVVALLLMSLVPLVDTWLMWLAAAVAGFSTATEFVCIILWVSKYMKFTGVAAAVCICGMGTGGMAGVEITGYFFDKGYHMMMVYCSLGACIAHFLLFVGMYFFAEWFHKSIEQQRDAKRSMKNKLVELAPLKDGDAMDNQNESVA